MGKLIVWNIMSLDGCFEGTQPWDLPTHELVWGPELEALSNEQLEDAEALLFGRRTFEGMASYWSGETGTIADGMNTLRKYVVSNTLDSVSWQNSSIISGDVAGEIRRIKSASARPTYVFGSANLVATLLAHDLVDEYRLCIAPILLGAGTPLFKPAEAKTLLTLMSAAPLANGGVLLKYALPPHG